VLVCTRRRVRRISIRCTSCAVQGSKDRLLVTRTADVTADDELNALVTLVSRWLTAVIVMLCTQETEQLKLSQNRASVWLQDRKFLISEHRFRGTCSKAEIFNEVTPWRQSGLKTGGSFPALRGILFPSLSSLGHPSPYFP
jgi:hypothetical protein